MQGLKRIAEELQAMRPEMEAMADTLAHYDMHKYLVTLIHGSEREELGVLAHTPCEAMSFVLNHFNYPLGSFAIVCKAITSNAISPESDIDQQLRFA
jgi:hypothetical protein